MEGKWIVNGWMADRLTADTLVYKSHTRAGVYSFRKRVSACQPSASTFYIAISVDFFGISFTYCLMLINWVLHRKKAASHSSETARLNGKKKNFFCRWSMVVSR